MTHSLEIHCVKRSNCSNAHERIVQIGGKVADGARWQMNSAEAIQYIESGTYAFHVGQGRRTVQVLVAVSGSGNKYLKTVADGEQPENLLSLPECP